MLVDRKEHVPEDQGEQALKDKAGQILEDGGVMLGNKEDRAEVVDSS